MDIQVKYTEFQSSSSTKRRGGVLLKGRALAVRQPVHLYFLIDTSGSMGMENKLENVQRSMNFILPFLTPEDQISLATFDSQAKNHLSRMVVSSDNKQVIEYKIQGMKPDGNTNLSAGLLLAGPTFEQRQTDGVDRKQGLIVLTDGHANVGVTDEALILQIVKSMMQKTPALSITTVAYGEDHNADLLSKMSIEGGGSYNIVKNLEDVASVFGEILGGLLSVAAQMIEVYLPPEAEYDSAYPSDLLEGGVRRIRIGDLYSEAEHTILFRSSPDQGPIRITAVTLPGFDRLDERIQPTLLEEGEIPSATLQLAEYRQQVSRLLKDVRSVARPTDELRRQANDLLLVLQASSHNENLLVKMMIEDLKFIVESHQTYGMNSMLTQHETYLGVCRGLRSPTIQHGRLRRARANVGTGAGAGPDSQGPDDPEVEQEPPQEQTSVFSNHVQRSITHNLRTMSQQPY